MAQVPPSRSISFRFFWHLVEDRSNFPGGGMSYAEFMQQVWQAIREPMVKLASYL
jgi:hypothetical protein